MTLLICCPKCGTSKGPDQFYRNASRKSGLSGYCKVCQAASNSKPTPESTRRWNLMRSYGMSIEDLEELLASQAGCCVICLTPISLSIAPRPHVDHCHSTGAVRGLLCRGCNIGLGHFNDDPSRLRRASSYLKREL